MQSPCLFLPYMVEVCGYICRNTKTYFSYLQLWWERCRQEVLQDSWLVDRCSGCSHHCTIRPGAVLIGWGPCHLSC